MASSKRGKQAAAAGNTSLLTFFGASKRPAAPRRPRGSGSMFASSTVSVASVPAASLRVHAPPPPLPQRPAKAAAAPAPAPVKLPNPVQLAAAAASKALATAAPVLASTTPRESRSVAFASPPAATAAAAAAASSGTRQVAAAATAASPTTPNSHSCSDADDSDPRHREAADRVTWNTSPNRVRLRDPSQRVDR